MTNDKDTGPQRTDNSTRALLKEQNELLEEQIEILSDISKHTGW